MADEYVLTKVAYDQLSEKLRYLRITGRADIAQKIKEAKSYGDLSENSEYDEAKSEQGKLEAEIAEIEYTLNHAKIIDETSFDSKTIHIGSSFKIHNFSTGATLSLKVVSAPNANPLVGDISDESPVGRAVVGHKTGEVVEVETPDGINEYEIIEIE